MKHKSITKKYNINGPVNIIRLTNGTKIVYIFGDLHFNLEEQTECVYNRDIESISIDNFFRKIFKKNPDRKFDFFYEGYINHDPKVNIKSQNEMLNINKYYTTIYFGQIIKLVFNNIDIVDNKIHTSKQFHNVRLHYFNFRYVIPHFIYLFDDIQNLINLKTSYNYNKIENYLVHYNRLLIDIKDFLISDTNSYIQKIKSKYSNKKIQDNIQRIYQIIIIDVLNIILKTIDDTIAYIKDTPKLFDKNITIDNKYELNKIIYINIEKICSFINNLCSNLIDIYLIRRLLDKDYINNCIIYTGAYHMIDITYILIKYFDFKITHIANSDKNIDNDKIENVNMIIKKKDITNYDDIIFLSNYLENNTYQCSNLFNFPDNLE
jgi:hypothetical protein